MAAARAMRELSSLVRTTIEVTQFLVLPLQWAERPL